jgi:hypothetical protein
MEFWPAPVMEIPVVIAQLAAEAMWELVLKVMRSAARGSVAANRSERERDSPERLGPEVPAQRLAQLALVFSALIPQRSIPWRAELGHEQCLCSYRSSRR